MDEGITGFKINTEAEMIAAVKNVNSISRKKCREFAKRRFDVPIIAKEYLDIVQNKSKRVVLLSTHQPAANPRAMKEYVTLKEYGYRVKVLYAYNANWSNKIDEDKFRKGKLRRQEMIEVGGNPNNRPTHYFMSRAINRIINILSHVTPIKNVSFDRVAFHLWIFCLALSK